MQKLIAATLARPSGFAESHSFQPAATWDVEILSVAYHEKQTTEIGLWAYDWRTGLDANVEPRNDVMWRYLCSNGPKQGLEFADYSFFALLNSLILSHPIRTVLFDYIARRVDVGRVKLLELLSTGDALGVL